MSEAKVVHCKREEHDVYIGRPSKWGNPFEIGRDGTREEVIEKHERWLYKWIKDREEIWLYSGSLRVSNREVMESLNELRGRTLGCWCSPQRCHGEVLLRLTNAADEEQMMNLIMMDDQ